MPHVDCRLPALLPVEMRTNFTIAPWVPAILLQKAHLHPPGSGTGRSPKASAAERGSPAGPAPCTHHHIRRPPRLPPSFRSARSRPLKQPLFLLLLAEVPFEIVPRGCRPFPATFGCRNRGPPSWPHQTWHGDALPPFCDSCNAENRLRCCLQIACTPNAKVAHAQYGD